MKKAFTLIELLVVIAIIALLSTLSVVALGGARAKARDARRLSDIKQIQTALEMYLDSSGTYPVSLTAGAPLSYGGLVFLSEVPSDPISSNQYVYAQTEGGQSYTLDFTTETKSSDYEAGNYQATPNGILAGGGGGTPPAFVCGDDLVDGEEVYSTLYKSGFCVMTKSLKRDFNGRLCYEDDHGNCDTFGGLYSYSNKSGLCPAGWRLPTDSDRDLFDVLCYKDQESFIGYFHSKEGTYKDDAKYLMTNDGDVVIDVISASLVRVPWPDSAVSVRCIKDPS